MLDILVFVVQVLESTIYIYITYKLLDRKLTIKNAVIIGVILGVFWDKCNILELDAAIDIFIYQMLMVLLVRITSHDSLFKVFISVFISSNALLIMEFTIIAFITMNQNISFQSHINNPSIYLMGYMLSFILGYIFYLILKKYDLSLFDRDQNYFSIERTFSQDKNISIRIKEITNNYNLVMIFFIIQMTLITYYFCSREYFNVYNPVEGNINIDLKTVLLSSGILIINIMTLFMAKKVLMVREENYYNKVKEMEFSQIENENLIIKQYKHDLNNHFNLLCGLAEEKKHDEVYSYLINYHEDIKSKTIPVKTGMNELDILLYSKINKAQQNNIKIDYKCFANIQCNKNYIIDFISIIGNLLDNAIEASQKSDKKIIGIYIDEEVLEYSFIIKNTFEEKALLTTDILLQEGFSTKGSGRGLGLKIVNRLVKKYNGNIEFNNDEEYFEIKVVLPKHELERY